MADYSYGGSEEENAELKKLEIDLVRIFGSFMATLRI